MLILRQCHCLHRLTQIKNFNLDKIIKPTWCFIMSKDLKWENK